MKVEPTTTERPWGRFRQFTHNELSTVKIITVNPNEELSLQYHEKRSEFWKVLSGNPSLVIGDQTINANVDDEFFITEKTNHRIKAGAEPVTILEISLGTFDENDIVRLEDKYGRI